jgi:phage terminase large subunit
VTADSARPDSIDFCRRHGIPRMGPAIKGQGSVEDGITFLQGLDIVLHPRCTATLNEFNRYSYKRDKQTEEILPVVEDAWNHAIDALRYGAERAHRKGKLVPGIVKTVRKPSDYGLTDEPDETSWKVA